MAATIAAGILIVRCGCESSIDIAPEKLDSRISRLLCSGRRRYRLESGAEMTRSSRRNYSPAFKAKVTVADLKRDAPLAGLVEHFDVHPNHITQWKSRLRAGAEEVFFSGSPPK